LFVPLVPFQPSSIHVGKAGNKPLKSQAPSSHSNTSLSLKMYGASTTTMPLEHGWEQHFNTQTQVSKLCLKPKVSKNISKLMMTKKGQELIKQVASKNQNYQHNDTQIYNILDNPTKHKITKHNQTQHDFMLSITNMPIVVRLEML